MALITCPDCKKQVSSNAKNCPNCGCPINTTITCPKCSSTNVQLISGASKAVSVALWGPFAANKVMSKYECMKCHHKFN